jgi:exodeoxyribonuclease VII large subunit
VVLLVRGGGSLEDLWAFNTEVVARAIASCPLPVVSGVGHEVDVTIADLVADERAATPSAAAERVLPDRAGLQRELQAEVRRLKKAMSARLQRSRARLERETEALKVLAPRARLASQRSELAALERRLGSGVRASLTVRRSRLGALAGRLHSLSPLAVLSRGYALVRRTESGSLVRSAREVAKEDRLTLRLADGEVAVKALAESDLE